MKVSISGRRLELKLHCEDEDRAWIVSKHNRALPPDGYTWLSSFFQKRRKHGRGIDLTLVFLLVDRDLQPIERHEAFTLFAGDTAVAEGLQNYPPAPDSVLSEHPD